MPDALLCGITATVSQPSAGAGDAWITATVDGSDAGHAAIAATIDRKRFLAFSAGLGSGAYASLARVQGVTVRVAGEDFTASLDGAVETVETLEDYIAVRTARLSLLDDRLALAHASTISDDERQVTIDAHVGPHGYPETWRAFDGYLQPQQNDEPFRPAATFQARSWVADLLGSQVCLSLPAFSGFTRAELLVLAAASAGWEVEISGDTAKRVRKPQKYDGVTFGDVARRLLEIEGVILREKGYGQLELVPESQWLGAAVDPDVARFTFQANDGVSSLPISEEPPVPEVTSWTIHGTKIGPGQSHWIDGTYENGVEHYVYWQLTGTSLMYRYQTDTTRQSGSAIASRTLIQIFDSVVTPGVPFYYATAPPNPSTLVGLPNGAGVQYTEMGQPSSIAHQQPTRLVSETDTHSEPGVGVFSSITKAYSWGDGYLPTQLLVSVRGLNGADIFGLLHTETTTWSARDVSRLAEGYTEKTLIRDGLGTLTETRVATYTVSGNGGWKKTIVTRDHTGGMPSVSVDAEEGEGPIPLPYTASDTDPIYELQPYSRTVSVTGTNFKVVEREEVIEELEDADEAAAVAWRRLRWQLSATRTREGLILPTLRVGDAAAIGDHARALDTAAGGVVTMATMLIGGGGPPENLSRRSVTSPPSYMLEPAS